MHPVHLHPLIHDGNSSNLLLNCLLPSLPSQPALLIHSINIMPYYLQQAARSIVTEVSQHPERAEALSETLQERIASLNVNDKKARVLLTTLIMEQNAAYMNQIDKVDTIRCRHSCTAQHIILFAHFNSSSNPLISTHSFNIPLNTLSQHSQVYNASGGAVEPAFKIMAAYTETHTALKKLTEPVFNGLDIPVPGTMIDE